MKLEDYLLLIHQQHDPQATAIPPDLMSLAWEVKSHRYALDTEDECDSFDMPTLLYYLWSNAKI